MSDLTKNNAALHVHFEDDVTSNEATLKSPSTDENGRQDEAIENNGTITLNYSRGDLLRLRNSLMAKRPPKFAADETSIDDKRKEKIRMLVKVNGGTNFTSSNKRTTLSTTPSATDRKDNMPFNESISLLPSFALGKHHKNAMSMVFVSPSGQAKETKDGMVADDEKLPSERDRLGFQQLMAAASGPNTVTPHVEQQIEVQSNSRRQRVGSGRIATENPFNCGGLWSNGYRHSGTDNDQDVAFHLNYGVDNRYSNNDFFDKRQSTVASTATQNRDRNQKVVDGGERSDAYEWNKENNRFPQISSRENSTEPEWVSCGPTSKHDIIELHGFDGPNADTDDNSKSIAPSTANSPPARSTPTKTKKYHEMPPNKNDEHFNFEDFFKLELPSGNHMARGPGSGGESRFSQWFRRDSPPKKNATGFDANNNGKVHGSLGQSFASTEQFIDLMHKTHGKKIDSNLMASSAKFRSVEELEAELVPLAATAKQMHRDRQEQTKAANDLIDFRKLLNQMEQQRILQQQQQHKARIVQQLCLLQQMNNTPHSQSERERETLLALLNVWNDNLMPRYMPQHQQQQHHQYQQQQPPPQFMPNGNIGQNFRQFQANIANGMPPHSPTQQELQFHTQAIMQNALLKKQYEDQYRKSQQFQKQHHRSSMTPSPQPLYHNNQNYGQPQFRTNKPKFNQMPKDGFQLMAPPQPKPIFGRFASQRAGHTTPMKFQNPASNAAAAVPIAPPATPVASNNSVDVTAVTSPAISVNADK